MPSLIGTKFGCSDLDQIMRTLHSPVPMNHFIGHESSAVLLSMWGNRGIYSDYALYWPKACMKLFALCEERKWQEALELQELFLRFNLEGQQPLMTRGYTDAAWDKGKTEAAGFLRCKRYIRPPHRCMSEEDVQHLRMVGRKYFSDWAEQ